MDSVRILVVEDEEPIRQGLLDVLVFHGFKAAGAADGEAGLTAVAAQLPDLVILDVMLPGLDGLEVCRRLRAGHADLPILMLTARGAEDDIVAGFNAGADDYVCKPFSLRELMVRVAAMLRRSGRTPQSPPVDLGGIWLEPGQLRLRAGEAVADLTRRECHMLAHLHRHRDRIVSRREFLAEVWGYDEPDLETRTVDIHLQRLRRKLAAVAPDAGPALIETVRGAGYRMRPTGSSSP
ncbi:MAG: response regulator transcription factor [Krumholzibacteria bacterium]|nr:response regulator transcription factor [Candidatus Krumholzibacteria bacterium]